MAEQDPPTGFSFRWTENYEDLHSRLIEAAEQEMRTQGEIIRKALDKYLKSIGC